MILQVRDPYSQHVVTPNPQPVLDRVHCRRDVTSTTITQLLVSETTLISSGDVSTNSQLNTQLKLWKNASEARLRRSYRGFIG